MKTVTERPSFQGDLMILRIDELPRGLNAVKPENGRFILAHSETGHHHVIDCKHAEVFEAADDEFIAWLHLSAPSKIEHQRSFDTHETLRVPAGTYEIRRQREHTALGYRRASD